MCYILLLTITLEHWLQGAYYIMATKKAETAVKEQIIDCALKNVQVYSGSDRIRYRLVIDTHIDAIVRNRETDTYEEGSVDYIDFVPRVLIAQCLANVEGLDLLYTKKKEQGLRNDNASGFGASELQVILRGAKLEIKRTRFEVGDEYTDGDGVVHVHDHAGYNTDIVSIKVSERIQLKLDGMIDDMFAM